jgi:outer membrane receptor for ferrienterochelin and colicins
MSTEIDDVLITAQHSPTHYTQAIHRVTVIKENTLIERGVTQLDQALELVPFIRIVNDGVLGSQIVMRGVGASNVAIMIDGVPVIGRLDGALDLSQISLKNVQRIEIIDGALSAILGNNAAGGVINIITKKSQLSRFELSGTHQVESIRSTNHQLNAGIKLGKFILSASGRFYSYSQYPSDSLRLTEVVKYENGLSITQTKYPWNPKDQYNYGAQLVYQHSDDQKIVAKFDRNTEDVTDYGTIRRPSFNPYANDVFFNTVRKDYTIIYNHKIKNKYYLELTAAYNEFNRVVAEKRYYLKTAKFDSLLQTIDTSQFAAYFSRATLSFPIHKNFELMVGGTYNNEYGKGDRIKIENPDLNSTVSTCELGLFSDLKYRPSNNLTLNTTIRLTTHNIYNNQVSLAFQGKYSPIKNWTIRAGYAQGYRSPSLKELYLEFIDVNHYILGNNALQPELSKDAQLTVNYNIKKDLDIGLNFYKTWIQNRITLTEYETLKYTYQNISSYSVFGIQPSLTWKLKGLESKTESSLGYWSSNISFEGTPVYGSVFDLSQTLRQNIKSLDLNLSVNYRYVGAQPMFRMINDNIQTDKIEAYHLLNISVQKSLFENKISLILGAKNLFNVQSALVSGSNGSGSHGSSGSSLISQGQSVFISLNWKI